MDYEQFMKECKAACHERHACADGYQMLLKSESVQDILMTVVRNWNDVWVSKYADIVAENITRWFSGLEKEFHDSGIFVNEDACKGIVMVSNPGQTLRFAGKAKVYLFGPAHVIATDHSQVYCRDAGGEVELYDYAYGKIDAGRVSAYNRATVESHQECTCHNYTTVYAYGGTLHDKGHHKLHLSDGVTVTKL